MNPKYKFTMASCFIGYIVQAIVCNFVPLLFITLNRTYDISLSRITYLVTMNFAVQLTVDAVSAKIIDYIGYRKAGIISHLLAATGLILLGILPDHFSDPFYGLMTAVVIYAIGGGMIEVILSPLVDSVPNENKSGAMTLLHSFYCWGSVAVIFFSTLFFQFAGTANWRILSLLWALVPLVNAVFFSLVPINDVTSEEHEQLSASALFENRTFWLMMILMITSGASEVAVSQWSSAFAEHALGVGKTVGDLAGPMLFGIMMGIARLVYGKFKNPDMKKTLLLCGSVCIVSYLVISFSPTPVIGLAGCALCGLSTGIMWPGTLSYASAKIKGGSTLMFAYLALGGDIGCLLGPTVAGKVAGAYEDDLKKGILAAIIFPILLVLAVFFSSKVRKNKTHK